MARRKNLGRAVDDLVAGLERGVLSARARDELAEAYVRQAATTIQRRTRQGYGVSQDGGTLQRLKPLSPAYVEQRKRARLSSFTSPGRSNLTFTGELLGSLGVERRAAGHWVITLEGTRDDGLPNAQLARFVSRERPFLNLAKSEIQSLERAYRRTFDELVKRKST